MLVNCVNMLYEELTLISHLNVVIDRSEDRQQVLGVDLVANIIKDIASLFKVVVTKWAKKGFFHRLGKLAEEVKVVSGAYASVFI